MTTDPHDPTDDALVQRCNGGDFDAFGALYRRHKPFVLRIALRYCHDEHEALDVVQDTFVAFARQFPGFRLTSRLTTYLFPIARNAALTRRRRSRRLSFTPDPPPRTDEPRATDPDSEQRDALSEALDRLPEGQREVLLLRAVEGLSVAETAHALSIPEGTVRSRLHHALRTLRADAALARLFADGPDEAD